MRLARSSGKYLQVSYCIYYSLPIISLLGASFLVKPIPLNMLLFYCLLAALSVSVNAGPIRKVDDVSLFCPLHDLPETAQ